MLAAAFRLSDLRLFPAWKSPSRHWSQVRVRKNIIMELRIKGTLQMRRHFSLVVSFWRVWLDMVFFWKAQGRAAPLDEM